MSRTQRSQPMVRRVAVAQQEVIAAATAYYSLWRRSVNSSFCRGAFRRSRADCRTWLAGCAGTVRLVDARGGRPKRPRPTLLGVEARQCSDRVSRLGDTAWPSATVPPSIDVQAVELTRAVLAPTDDPPAFIVRSLTLRGELVAVEMERTMLLQQVRLLPANAGTERDLSAFAQSDGFDELVLRGGLAMGCAARPVWSESPR